jgi:hypothetical protein
MLATSQLALDNEWAEYRKYLYPTVYSPMGIPDVPELFTFTDPPIPNKDYHRTALHPGMTAAAILEANRRATLDLTITYTPYAWMRYKPEDTQIEDDESLLHGPLKVADNNKDTYFLSKFGHYFVGPTVDV